LQLLRSREHLVPAYRLNKQEQLTNLQSIVPQASSRLSRRLGVQRTVLLDQALSRVALRHNGTMCLARRAPRIGAVRLVREETRLSMKAHLVHRPPGRSRLDLRMRRMPRPRLGQRHGRRAHHGPQRIDPKVRLIRSLRLGHQPLGRRTRLIHKRGLDPRMRRMLNPRPTRRLLPDLRLSPIQQRGNLVLKSGDPSSKAGALHHTARSTTLRAVHFWCRRRNL
jgi:hypothetical protein